MIRAELEASRSPSFHVRVIWFLGHLGSYIFYSRAYCEAPVKLGGEFMLRIFFSVHHISLDILESVVNGREVSCLAREIRCRACIQMLPVVGEATSLAALSD